MIVGSNTITSLDIQAAIDATGGIYLLPYGEHNGENYPRMIRFFKPHHFIYGYEFFCGGSSFHASAHDSNYKAATWVEWGLVIDRLYKIDPNAQIGHYKNRDDFMRQTRDNYRIRRGEVTLQEASWLRVAPNETRKLLREYA